VLEIQAAIKRTGLYPCCMATGCADLLSDDEYEPSMITSDSAGRLTRMELLLRAVEIANDLGIPVLNFSSGLLKTDVQVEAAEAYLVNGIRKLLEQTTDIVLAIEPEPKMFVETTTQAIDIINKVGSERLRLNLDIGHVYCCEDDYLERIRAAAQYTVHVHIEDIRNRVHHHEIPGTGDIDLGAVIEILEQEKYEHYVSVELYHFADVWRQALSESMKHLKSLMN
jgi:sugar phosphate isomerase/epimerase